MLASSARKLEDNIVLSIQYSRLLEEIDDTELKIQVINDKKFDLAKSKKIQLNENYIKEVKNAIKDIKDNYPENKYNLYITDTLEAKLKSLSKQKNYETIKYNIAIRTILDNVVDYHNTDDYLEDISQILFEDKSKIKQLKKELYKIYGILTNTKQEVQEDSLLHGIVEAAAPEVGVIMPAVPAVGAVIPAAKKFLPKLKSAGLIVLNGIKKHPKVSISLAIAGSAVAIGGGLITGFRKRRKTVKALKKIASEDLEYILLVNALCLKTAFEYMDEVQYYKYFQNKMRVINSFKKKIDKELFVKWFDAEDNSAKLMLLNRFDEYLIKHVKFVEK